MFYDRVTLSGKLHAITKPASLKTFHDLGLFFSNFVGYKYKTFTEVHLIFDSFRTAP